MVYTQKWLDYIIENNKVFHLSKYHHEDYMSHCLMVVGKAVLEGANEALIIAAMLHDIAKPRTAGTNKKGGACFYGHEEVSKEELAEFISTDDVHFNYVYELIRAHMLPYKAEGPEPWASRANRELERLTKEFGEGFRKDLDFLHFCDEAGSCRTEEEVKEKQRLLAAGIVFAR